MALVPTSSSSFAQSLPKKYDVFISFRGEDTRSNFTSHLHDAFRRKKIKTFKDDNELIKGYKISPSLLQAIEDSCVSVVIFSKDYASSTWCLDELTHINLCRKVQGQIVIPIFYKVEPSEVRHQTGPYKQAFERHERDLKLAQNKMQTWKQALRKTANLAGHDSSKFRDESKMIQEIVRDILQKLNHKSQPAKLKGLVGIEDKCAEIESQLRDAETIGIWGMGGIGKSTLAKTIFSKYSSHYERSCFLENVREKSKNGLDELRHNFLSCLLKEDPCIDPPTSYLEHRLKRMKVFVVLDDVNDVEQLEYLVGDLHCFGEGSKILITTRDKRLLISKEVKVIYEVKELGKGNSFKLFCLNAFKIDHPIMGYKKLTERAVDYAKGIPLALKVLGSYLYKRSKVVWKSALRELKKSPYEDIQKVLKLSYDGLHNKERRIFLDIAFCLNGWPKESVIYLLEKCGFCGARIGIEVLQEKGLINVGDDMHIKTHDLIKEMGLQVIREESVDEPQRRSRLWDSEEIYDLFFNNVGSNKVQGIKLNVSEIRDLHLKADVFEKMPNIRYLIFYSAFNRGSSHVHLPEGLAYLPYKLRYLEWYGFPLKYLPSSLHPEKIVKLSMPNSHLLELWKGEQDFVNLQEMDLSGSKQLQKLPNLSKCSNLKVVRLRECESLCYVHSSFLSLHSLVLLDLYRCKNLRSLKSEFHLRSLQHINVGFCWNLKEFAVSSAELRKLLLCNTRIEILDPSVGCSSNLEELNLSGTRLAELPNQLSCLTSLTILRLQRCEFINDLKLRVLVGGMLSLREVYLAWCCNITKLPKNTKRLLGLKLLWLTNCRRLRSLPKLPPSIERLHAVNCKKLELVPTWRPSSGGLRYFSFKNCVRLNEQSFHNIMEASYYVLHKNMNRMYRSIVVAGSNVPRWFRYRAAGSSIIVEVPQISDLADFSFCLVIGFYSEIDIYSDDPDIVLKCTCYLLGLEAISSQRKVRLVWTTSDHVFVWNDAWDYGGKIRGIRRGNQQLFTNTKLCFEFTVDGRESSNVVIKKCGVCPVYASEYQKFDEEMKIERVKKRPQDVEEQQPLPQFKRLRFANT